MCFGFEKLDRAVDPGHRPLGRLDRAGLAAGRTFPRDPFPGGDFVRHAGLGEAAEELPQLVPGFFNLAEVDRLLEHPLPPLLLNRDLRDPFQKSCFFLCQLSQCGIHALGSFVAKSFSDQIQRPQLTKQTVASAIDIFWTQTTAAKADVVPCESGGRIMALRKKENVHMIRPHEKRLPIPGAGGLLRFQLYLEEATGSGGIATFERLSGQRRRDVCRAARQRTYGARTAAGFSLRRTAEFGRSRVGRFIARAQWAEHSRAAESARGCCTAIGPNGGCSASAPLGISAVRRLAENGLRPASPQKAAG